MEIRKRLAQAWFELWPYKICANIKRLLQKKRKANYYLKVASVRFISQRLEDSINKPLLEAEQSLDRPRGST